VSSRENHRWIDELLSPRARLPTFGLYHVLVFEVLHWETHVQTLWKSELKSEDRSGLDVVDGLCEVLRDMEAFVLRTVYIHLPCADLIITTPSCPLHSAYLIESSMVWVIVSAALLGIPGSKLGFRTVYEIAK
jgi:hypothetical protein